MNPGTILALVCLMMSISFLLYLIFGKGRLCRSKFRKYLIASCSMYVSGTLLIFIILILAEKMPFQFAVMSEGFILFVFLMTMFTLLKIGTSLDEMQGYNSVKKDDPGEER